jgi:IS1 family transposase
VYQWIKQYREKARLDVLALTEIEVIERDEMHSFVGSKKACWLWIAVDRLGHRFLNVIVGSRDTDTGSCLWEGLAHHDIGHIMTDYWKLYELFLPSERHTQSKAETFTVEGYNSLFRHFLARLRRKSKCYSKSMEMLLYSVTLLMLKRNRNLNTIFN